jgi:hypothetical protein
LNEKLKAALIIVGVILAITVPIAVAAYWVYSNAVAVNVAEKAIALSVETNGLEVTLTASGVNAGASVAFGTTSANPPSDATFTVLHTNVADGSGVATYTYTAAAGSYMYAARAYNTDIP